MCEVTENIAARVIDPCALKEAIYDHCYLLRDPTRSNTEDLGMYFCGIARLIDEAPSAIIKPSYIPVTHVYGYPIDHLIVFAQMCRKAEVEPHQMRELRNNLEYLMVVMKADIQRSTQQLIQDCIKRGTEGATQQ